jgi:hypothetical protein
MSRVNKQLNVTLFNVEKKFKMRFFSDFENDSKSPFDKKMEKKDDDEVFQVQKDEKENYESNKIDETNYFKVFFFQKTIAKLSSFDNHVLSYMRLQRDKYIQRLKKKEEKAKEEESKGRKQFDILRRTILSDISHSLYNAGRRSEKIYSPQKDPTIDKSWTSPSFEEEFFRKIWEEERKTGSKSSFRQIFRQWKTFRRYSFLRFLNTTELKVTFGLNRFYLRLYKFFVNFIESTKIFSYLPSRQAIFSFVKKTLRIPLFFFKVIGIIISIFVSIFFLFFFSFLVICFWIPLVVILVSGWFAINKFFFVVVPLIFRFLVNVHQVGFIPLKKQIRVSRVGNYVRSKPSWEEWVDSYHEYVTNPFFNFYYKSLAAYNRYWIEIYRDLYGVEDARDRRVNPSTWRWNQKYWDALNPYEKQQRYERVTRRAVLYSLFYKLPIYYSKKFFRFFFIIVPLSIFFRINHFWTRFLQHISLFYYGECLEYDRVNEKKRSDSFRPIFFRSIHISGIFGKPRSKSWKPYKNYLGLQFFPDTSSKINMETGEFEFGCDEYDLYKPTLPLIAGDGTVKSRFRKQGRPRFFDVSGGEESLLVRSSSGRSANKSGDKLKDEVFSTYPWLFQNDVNGIKRFYSWRDDEHYYNFHSDPYPLIPLRVGIYKSRFKFINALNRRLDELDWVNYVEIKTRAWKFRNDHYAVEHHQINLDKNTLQYRGYWEAWRQFIKIDRSLLYKNEFPEESFDDKVTLRPVEWVLAFFWTVLCICFAFLTFVTFPIVAFLQFINQVTSFPVIETILYYISYFFCFFFYTLPKNWFRLFWPLIKFILYTKIYLPSIGWFVYLVIKPIYRGSLVQHIIIPYIWEPIEILTKMQLRMLCLGGFYTVLRRFLIAYMRVAMILGYIFDFIMEFICWCHYFYFIFPQYVAPRMARNYFTQFAFVFFGDLGDYSSDQFLKVSIRSYNVIQQILQFFFYVFLAVLRYIPFTVLVWYTWYVIHTDLYGQVFGTLLNVRLFFYPYPLHPYTVITFIQIFYISAFRMACPTFSRFIEFEMFEIYWGTLVILWLCYVHPELTLWGDIPYVKKLFPRLLRF